MNYNGRECRTPFPCCTNRKLQIADYTHTQDSTAQHKMFPHTFGSLRYSRPLCVDHKKSCKTWGGVFKWLVCSVCGHCYWCLGDPSADNRLIHPFILPFSPAARHKGRRTLSHKGPYLPPQGSCLAANPVISIWLLFRQIPGGGRSLNATRARRLARCSKWVSHLPPPPMP